jgi:cytochrome P450 family 6
MKGDKWKYARSKLAPAFATGKIRNMFPLILEVCEDLIKNLQRKIDSDGGAFEAHNLSADYTTDVVGSCAFGIKSGSLTDPNNIFRNMGRNMLLPESFRRQMEIMIAFSLPTIAKIFKIKLVSQSVEDFFKDLILKAFAYREKHPEFKRNDFINLLMQLKKLGKVEVDEDDKIETPNGIDKDIDDKGKIGKHDFNSYLH